MSAIGYGRVKGSFIAKIFKNRATGKFERHVFPNADTLKIWVISMCGPNGDYEYKDEVFNV
jgi:hypothetical protein